MASTASNRARPKARPRHIPAPVGQVVEIRMDQIQAGDNDRVVFDDESLQALARSIETAGLIQPITVRRLGRKYRYEIVAGERRFRAHQILGADTINAIVEALDDDAASDRMLGENGPRVQLDPMTEAEAFRKRIDDGRTDEEVAAIYGVSTKVVNWRLDLMKLDDPVKDLVRSGQISANTAWALTRLNHANQREAVKLIAAEDLTPAKAIKVIERLRAVQDQADLFDADAFEMAVDEWRADEEAAARRATRRQLVALLTEAAAHVDDNALSAKIAEALTLEGVQ